MTPLQLTKKNHAVLEELLEQGKDIFDAADEVYTFMSKTKQAKYNAFDIVEYYKKVKPQKKIKPPKVSKFVKKVLNTEWESRAGKIKLKDMDDWHLKNVIRFLKYNMRSEKKYNGYTTHEWIIMFTVLDSHRKSNLITNIWD